MPLPGPQKRRRPDGGPLPGRALQVPRRLPVLPQLSHERRVVRGDRPVFGSGDDGAGGGAEEGLDVFVVLQSARARLNAR